MPLYTFHPCRPDGASLTFVAVELEGETEIRRYARRLLAQHPSCAWIEVWQDEREVGRLRPADLEAERTS